MLIVTTVNKLSGSCLAEPQARKMQSVLFRSCQRVANQGLGQAKFRGRPEILNAPFLMLGTNLLLYTTF